MKNTNNKEATVCKNEFTKRTVRTEKVEALDISVAQRTIIGMHGSQAPISVIKNAYADIQTQLKKREKYTLDWLKA